MRLTPSRIVALSFFLVITVGGLILSLPISQAPGVRVEPLDAFFTSSSAVCVTGLVTVTTATSWSIFGKVVILLLIQIGGLSFTTLFMLVMVQLGRKVTLKARLNLQASFNANDLSGMVKMLLLVIRGTFLAEGIGLSRSVFYGVFHSISAFCNAGFDLIGEASFIPYADRTFFNFIITTLIITGGIGFTVWRDIYVKIKFRLAPNLKRKIHLTTHSKMALVSTAFLILFGMLFFFANEYDNPGTLGPMPVGEKLLASYFQSVTLRTAGFATISQDAMKEGSKLMSSVMMLIGGSPGGTAGGMKTVTLMVLLLGVWGTLRGDGRLNVFQRSLPIQSLQKALTVVVAMVFLWFAGSLALSFTEANAAFPHGAAEIMFEVSSALGTVGLTTGLTPYLSSAGKVILILLMYIGRIGPLTLVVSASHRTASVSDRIHYPNEDVLIG